MGKFNTISIDFFRLQNVSRSIQSSILLDLWFILNPDEVSRCTCTPLRQHSVRDMKSLSYVNYLGILFFIKFNLYF